MIISNLSGLDTSGNEGYCFVTQNDHAAFAADLLSLWPALGQLDEHPQRAQAVRRLVLRATRLHDNGWDLLDAAPHLREDGRPHDFLTLPTSLRIALWERASTRYVNDEPAIAALISLHAIYLLSSSETLPAHTIEHLNTRVDKTIDAIGWSRGWAEQLHAWLRLADALSLQVCSLRPGTQTLAARSLPERALGRPGPLKSRLSLADPEPSDRQPALPSVVLALKPFPLAGPSTLHFTGRLIPTSRFSSSTEVALELAQSRWQRLRCSIRPLD